MSGYSRFGNWKSDQKNVEMFGLTDLEEYDDDMSEYSSHLPDELTQDIRKNIDRCADKFGFQKDSKLNVFEMISSLILSRYQRSSSNDYDETLQLIHQDLLSNFNSWKQRMGEDLFENYTSTDRRSTISRICLYLLIWTESANLRYCPEFICFIFQLALESSEEIMQCESFVDHAIVPTFRFLKDQIYKQNDDNSATTMTRRFRDHSEIVGYDDLNETFWYKDRISALTLNNGEKLMLLQKSERFKAFTNLNISNFRKTFYERRSPLHVYVNFISVWNIHFTLFYYYLMIVLDIDRLDMKVLAFGGGGLCSLLTILLALIVEPFYLPFNSPLLRGFFWGLVKAFLLVITNAVIPVTFLLFFRSKSPNNVVSISLAFLQCFISLSTSALTIYNPRLRTITQVNGNISQATSGEKVHSIVFWSIVFLVKAITSFFYLILPFSKPLHSILSSSNFCDSSSLCSLFVYVTAALLLFLNLILFILDSYVWYIAVQSAFGVYEARKSGLSLFTPWKQSISDILSKIQNAWISNPDEHMEKSATIWNAILFSWYDDNILSKPQVEKLISKKNERGCYQSPNLLAAGTDGRLVEELNLGPEAIRRISFLCQSLYVFYFVLGRFICSSSGFPSPLSSVSRQAPVLTVLIPHYAEKIIVSLRDLIHDYEGRDTFISLLDYLKSIYSDEWDCYVDRLPKQESHARQTSKNAVGFSGQNDEDLLDTRIWASVRSQTLFRTISGFQHYLNASTVYKHLEGELSSEVRKCNILVAVQRYAHMNKNELLDVEFMLRSFKGLRISFVEFSNGFYYNCLVDSRCPRDDSGRRLPKYRIRLPGVPILGDGKADNQNHSVIFCRGEVLQLIDANQDNYLEEAFKLPHTLADMLQKNYTILGTRENIFSNGIGILGDVAASKEYTFGTITQRVLSSLNSRLHYGHPDFLNSVFMLTRGGVSKGQKGLHLNEDIFAGMNALLRGGIVRHSEYMQSGKGRDLAFTSIMSFVSKIGSGSGEQMLAGNNIISVYFFHLIVCSLSTLLIPDSTSTIF